MNPKFVARNGVKKYKSTHIEQGVCVWCNKPRDLHNKRFCKAHAERVRLYSIRRNKVEREKVLTFYGRYCVCCGEENERFLTVDHINNNGAERRRGSGTPSASVAIREHYPLDLQILCFNCNCGRAKNRNECPHKEMKCKKI